MEIINDYYVYAYLREDDTPYYIGKGCRNRHLDYHGDIVVPPEERIIFLNENLTEQESFSIEAEYIKTYGRKGIDPGGILENRALSSTPEKKIKRKKKNEGKTIVAFYVEDEVHAQFFSVCKINRKVASTVLRDYLLQIISENKIPTIDVEAEELDKYLILNQKISEIENLLKKHKIQ
jgi:hypothetical protein